LTNDPAPQLVSTSRAATVERIDLPRSMRPLRSVAVSTRFDSITGMQVRMVFGMQHSTALSAQQQEIIDRLCLAMRDTLRMRQEHLEDTGRLAALYMASPALLLMLDAEACVLAASALCNEHFGWARQSVVGVELRTLLSERSRVEFDAHRTNWWRQGGCRDWPCQMVAADQSLRDVLLSLSIEFGPTGEAVSVKCAVVDVTELSKAS
jgi:PAS domain-containing protein